MAFDLSNLTTPEKIDKYVKSFCRGLSTSESVFVDVQPESWCKQACCEMNVEKLIQSDHGEKIIGYKIWYVEGKYIEAERHVIHRNEGVLRDPTFNADGEQKILFSPDPDSSINYGDRPIKIRRGLSMTGKRFAREANLTAPFINPMSKEESWEKMISYEDWLAGKRMPSVWLEGQTYS